jgi:hypothetical protein
MKAAGRVPCRCGATLILEPPRGPHPLSAPDLARADITTLGYTIRVETHARSFHAAHGALRTGLGLDSRDDLIPDPARASRPALLWPALGAAWDPRLVILIAALGLLALEVRWPLRLLMGGHRVSPLVEMMATVIACSVMAALAAVMAALSTHAAVVERKRPSGTEALVSLLSDRRKLALSAVRGVMFPAFAAGFSLVTVAALIALHEQGGVAAAISAISPPIQALLMLLALAWLVSLVGSLLAHAAVAPAASGQLSVQVDLEIRRVWGRRSVVPARPFGPGLAAALALALALGSAAEVLFIGWSALSAAFGPAAGPTGLTGVGHAIGRDLIFALAGAVWVSFVGVAGLLGGYALGVGAPREPVRAPEIITGTHGELDSPADDAPETSIATSDLWNKLHTGDDGSGTAPKK